MTDCARCYYKRFSLTYDRKTIVGRAQRGPVDELWTIIARRGDARYPFTCETAALDSERSDAGGVSSVMIYPCGLHLTPPPFNPRRLPSVVRLRGYSIFILTTLRILITDTYFTRHWFLVIAVTVLLSEGHSMALSPLLSLVYLHLFLVLRAEFMGYRRPNEQRLALFAIHLSSLICVKPPVETFTMY